MKYILVACGTGMATSTMIANKVARFLAENNVQVETSQCTLNEIPSNLSNKNLIITAMKVETEYDVPCINGSAFLTGINVETVKEQILSILL